MATARRWVPSGLLPGAGGHLAGPLGLHPLVADLLHARGTSDPAAAHAFLNPSLSDLAQPGSQQDVGVAADRLAEAIEEDVPITVYGDYDVDGQCGTALLAGFLDEVGGSVDTYTPSRFTEGYGLSEAGIKAVAERGTRVLVTVDCGIQSHDEIALAGTLGMDVVVCDHHQVGEALPPAMATLNPMREDCGFAGRLPCATGVAFNLICALRSTLRDLGWFSDERPEPNLKSWMDLVALATVCDVVPLAGHNRVLVAHGLQVVSRGSRPGIRALCEVSDIRGAATASDLGFRLGPRLNACGRLGDAGRGVRLLTTRDPEEARALARELDEENRRRRDIQAQITADAIERIEAEGHAEGPALVLGSPDWHAGVLGIVAAKLTERYALPTVLVGFDGALGRGSARTVGDFDVGGAMKGCRDHLVAGGGHAAAAGLTVERGSFDAFRDAFCAEAAAATPAGGFERTLEIDAEVELGDVTGRLVDDLARLEPFGAGNREPVLASRGVYVSDVRILKGEHVSCRVGAREGAHTHRAIGFGMAEKAPRSGDRVDVAYHAGWNEYRGSKDLQLMLRDLRPKESP